jgi:hypothetical protein
MSLIRTMALLGLAAFTMAADKDGADPEPPPSTPGKADIRGMVTAIAPLGSKLYLGRLTVEGKKEKDTVHEKASVLVRRAAKVYLWKGGKKVDATFDDIKVGCKIQCTFIGTAAGTTPPTGRAVEVIILGPAKK